MDYFHLQSAANNAIINRDLNTSESPLPSGSKPQKKVAGNMVILVEYFLQNFSTENIPFYMPNSNTHTRDLIQRIFKYSPIQ